ncbi:isocitrate lyase/phosphoenolpyruvate mutase family protein [Sphingomonas sp. NSE70-1]|uniref:Isocitrate lyase/phosphoenolpyruvate mutase family protein n=1 Tax=Sphingomonas caseinilyticus TaxID=2908205 RepID=A0ABT0RU62_9SPHN|nr:isocitrate lyase/phosphoenolpyruvate mutase family protein [Sphingomonas caseinilyticus]MCL6698562.1 isocitrate lyase/phosphoenolpyruvate mutase family protein [Sphingomonas caseinilyticus]
MANELFRRFAALHVSGDPLVLFNIWDAGSALAVVKAGAKAIATGSASVAMANGFGDGENLPMEFALANARRIAESVDLPVTVDFEGAYSNDADEGARNIAELAATGVVGCNFEDQVVGGEGLHSIDVQAQRIAAARAAVGPDFFINVRTDLFLKVPQEAHDGAMLDEAIARGRAYAEAGASGFFVPMLGDLDLLRRLCDESAIPVNFMTYPGCPSNAEVAATGVARVSHGPFPHMALMKQLEEAAGEALA